MNDTFEYTTTRFAKKENRNERKREANILILINHCVVRFRSEMNNQFSIRNASNGIMP